MFRIKAKETIEAQRWIGSYLIPEIFNDWVVLAVISSGSTISRPGPILVIPLLDFVLQISVGLLQGSDLV